MSRDQASAAGLSRTAIEGRVGSGAWERIFRGVYRLAGAPASWHQRLLAACLAAGPSAAASLESAAVLWDLPGASPDAVCVSVHAQVRRDLPGVRVRRVRDLGERDRVVVAGIPVTDPTRTLIDLAGTWSPDALEEALDDALRRRLTTVARIRRRIDDLGSKGRPGAAVLRALLAERTGTPVRSESVFETRLLRALRRAGLPEPTAQFVVRSGGRFVARVDLAYPDARLAIEADGFRHHAGRRRFEHDRARLAALAAGWRVIPVTWRQLGEDPASVVERVRAALPR